MKSALIETTLIGDGDYLYKPNIPNLKKNIDISPKIIDILWIEPEFLHKMDKLTAMLAAIFLLNLSLVRKKMG